MIIQIGDGNFIRGFFDILLQNMTPAYKVISVGATLKGYTLKKFHSQNGTHILMVAFGKLYNLKTVRQAIKHNITSTFIKKLTDDFSMRYDIEKQYIEDVFERLQNPYIENKLLDIQLMANTYCSFYKTTRSDCSYC